MAWFDRLTAAARLAKADLASPLAAANTLSPAVVVAEALQLAIPTGVPTRSTAIQVPAIARARALIVSSIAPLPLVALRKGVPVQEEQQPGGLSSTGNMLESPYDRMAWTLDDLFFYGLSLWAVKRGAEKTDGRRYGNVLAATRVPYDKWDIDREGRVLVQITEHGPKEPVNDADVLLFTHPSQGLLNSAATTINAATAIQESYVSRARNPIPLTVIEHQSGAESQAELTEDEIADLLDQWTTARQGPNGALGYLPPTLRMSTPGAEGAGSSTMLELARNAVRIDTANHASLPASMLDGGIAEESLTYRNAEGDRSRFWTDLAYWTDPVQHRLSLDDVVPRGQSVRFDRSEYDYPAAPATGTPVED